MNPATILKLVLLLGVVQLVVAIGIRARPEDSLTLLRRPALALRAMVAMYVALLATLADRVGGAMLLVGAGVLLVAHSRTMVGVLGQGTLIVIGATIAFGLLVGHLLGGPDPGNRRALASATVSRHPAIALLLAAGAFPEQESTVIGTDLLCLLAALLLAVPYGRRRGSSHAASPHGSSA